MANTYTYTGPGTRWAAEDATSEDYLNVARINVDHVHEALNTIMDTSASDGIMTGTVTAHAGTLDGVLGSITPAAATVTTLNASSTVAFTTNLVTFYRAASAGNPEFHMGASAAEELTIQTVYDAGAETLDYVTFTTDAASTDANKGEMRFLVDGTQKLTINDAGIAITGEATATGFTGTLDGILGSGAPAAATVTTLAAGGDVTVANGYGMVVGHTAQTTVTGVTPEFQMLGTGFADSFLCVGRWSDDATPPFIGAVKSRHATIGSSAIVENGDGVLDIVGYIDDGADVASDVARIRFIVDDANPAENQTGGAILFNTTTVTGATATEALRIDSSGNVGIGVTPTNLLSVEGAIASDWIAEIKQTHATAGQSYGLNVAGGTNSSDQAFRVTNEAESILFNILGSGAVKNPVDNAGFHTGASDDLRMFVSSGSGEVVSTGVLYLKAAAQNILQGTQIQLNNAAASANMLVATQGGAVTLYHNNVAKLATTATGASINSVLTLGVHASTNGVINAPEAMYFNIDSDGTQTDTEFVWGKDRATDTGGTTLMYLSEAGSLGIGVAAPTDPLHVKTTAVETRISLESSTGKWAIGAEDNDKFGILNYGTSTPFIIDSSGLVGIGVVEPLTRLHVKYGGQADLRLDANSGSGESYDLQSKTDGSFAIHNADNGVDRMSINSTGNVGIGASAHATNRLYVQHSITAGALNTAPVMRIKNGAGSGNYVAMHFGGAVSDGFIGFLDHSTASSRMLSFAPDGAASAMQIKSGGAIKNPVDNAGFYTGAGDDFRMGWDGAGGILDVDSHGLSITYNAAETMASFAVGGAVTLYHDNVVKLATTAAGIDVTGTLAASSYITTTLLSSSGDVTTGSAGAGKIRLMGSETNSAVWWYTDGTYGKIHRDNSNGNMVIQSQTVGTTNLLLQPDAGNVGIGVTPTNLLSVEGAIASDWIAEIKQTHATAGQSYGLNVTGGTNASDQAFRVANEAETSLLIVQGDGEVQIGTTAFFAAHTLATTQYGINVCGNIDIKWDFTNATFAMGGGAAQFAMAGSGIKFASAGACFEVKTADYGNNNMGGVVSIGRNTNATNAAAGMIVLHDKAGAAHHIWVDANGDLRISTTAPFGTTDTSAGAVVGSQS